jgi:hypothetical protein
MILPANEQKSVQFKFKSVGNEGHFTTNVETVFRLYLPKDCSGFTEKGHIVLSLHALQQCTLVSNRSVMMGTLLMRSKQFFVRTSPRFAVASLRNTIFYFLLMRYKQWMLSWSRSLRKGPFLFRWKHIFVWFSTSIAVESLSNTIWYLLRMCCKQCKLRWRLSVMKATLLLRPKQFSVCISPGLQLGHWVTPHGNPCTCATSSAS